MTDPTPRDAALESLVRQAVADLPQRRAPATLEARVHDELLRRATLPWWRRGFEHWPLQARCVFVALCGGVMALSIWAAALPATARSLDAVGGVALAWAHPVLAAIATGRALAALLGNVVPPEWLSVGLGLGAVLYMILFGLGAAAYRALYLGPSSR